MKVTIELPRDWECESCEVNASKQQIVITPRFLRNQKSANVLFAKVDGDAGRECRTVLSVSGKTGQLIATAIKESTTKQEFDKPQEEQAKPETPPNDDEARRRRAAQPPVAPPES